MSSCQALERLGALEDPQEPEVLLQAVQAEGQGLGRRDMLD